MVVYKAAIRLAIEYSSFDLNPNIDRQYMWLRLSQAPQFGHQHSWPPRLTNDAAKNFQLFALAHMKVLFDLNALLPDATPGEMRRATYSHFLIVDPNTIMPQDRESYRRFFVEAGVYEDGNSYWERSSAADGLLPPGLNGEVMHPEKDESDVDLYLKSLIRAELIERMEAIR